MRLISLNRECFVRINNEENSLNRRGGYIYQHLIEVKSPINSDNSNLTQITTNQLIDLKRTSELTSYAL